MLSSGSCSWVRGGVLGEADRSGSHGGLPSPAETAPLLLAARPDCPRLRVPLLLYPCALLRGQPPVGARALLLHQCHAGRTARLALAGEGFAARARGWDAASLLGARVEDTGIMNSV